MVNTLHEGSLFTKYFASLEKGMLCIYKNEEEYQEYEAPVLEPLVMSEYRLVLDPQEIRMTSENPSHGSFRKRLSGHSNLTYLQSFELGEAAQKYVFNLVPKVIPPIAVLFIKSVFLLVRSECNNRNRLAMNISK